MLTKKRYAIGGLLVMGLFFQNCHPAKMMQDAPKNESLIWSDEFNYTGLPDSTKWSYEVGNGSNHDGWGNQEWQYYTDHRRENARVENGALIIEARKEAFEKMNYTSARLATKNKGDWKYGHIEIRAKLPRGRGTWPAL